ncbi:HIT domain-containing protein [Zavarzinia aquatilis]|uniref:Diadenosine tetraphosphate hydrolase n=1 Tax=Zavarzinia aquatilis TaxID=2211142 RepID=A0A317EHI3_9PROT|nr:HIT family protein [Zavarzinia aquatilis]PWR25530.1 diadenosine tetraphosphate hydrolase [Zavarzinia aquatilis]
MTDRATDFLLDPRLAADTVTLGDWPLCRVLMMNERRYPWIILVPRRPGLVEMLDLSPEDSRMLWEELHQSMAALRGLGTKINVGALGNIVRQLHVHAIARTEGDPAWPGPVWGHSPREPWPDAGEAAAELRRRLNLPQCGI